MADIGATLREARMRAKIDISEVESETKIRAKYLRALENEEWNLLPGSTFVKSFLRTYADYLGLDARLLIEEYKARFEPLNTAEMQPFSSGLGSRRERQRVRTRGPSRGVAVTVVIVLLVGALFALGKLFPSDSGDGTSASAPTTTQTTPKRARTTTQPAATSPAPQPSRVRLEILPTGPVWICLLDARGRKLIGGRTVQPGERLATFRSRRFTVNFGNGSVDMKVNGRTLPVADTAGAIGYTVTSRGRTVLPAGKRPTCA